MPFFLKKLILLDMNFYSNQFPWQNFWTGLGVSISYLYFINTTFYKNLNNKYRTKIILFLLFCFSISLLGARLFNIFLLREKIKSINLLIMLFNGGLTFYGGLIVFILCIISLSNIVLRYNSFLLLKEIIPLVVLYHAFARIGCFFAGCCYGKEVYIKILCVHIERYPTQIMESIFLFILFFIIKKFKEMGLYIYFWYYGFIRFLLEFLRGDERGKLVTDFFSPSQEISIALIIITIIVFLIRRKEK